MKQILTKLHAIMSEVDRIEKDGTNDFHKYKYASEKIINEVLHAALVKHRVLFYVTAATLKADKFERLTSVILTYRFCDVDRGEFIEGQGVGQGQAPDDILAAIHNAAESELEAEKRIANKEAKC